MPVTSAPFHPLASLGRRGARGSPRLALLDGGMDALPRTTANRQPSPATSAYPHPYPNMADLPIKIPPENSLRAIFFSTLPSSFSNHSHKRPVSAPICSSPPPPTGDHLHFHLGLASLSSSLLSPRLVYTTRPRPRPRLLSLLLDILLTLHIHIFSLSLCFFSFFAPPSFPFYYPRGR